MTNPNSPLWTGGDLPAAGLSWLLDSFVTPFVKTFNKKWKDERERIRWDRAILSYGQSVQRHFNNLRILGKNEDVPLGSIFTDVYILEQVSARRRYGIEDFTSQNGDSSDHDLNMQAGPRRNGIGLVNQGESLYILGKPGAGKTTFLKNVALASINNQLGKPTSQRLPLFISLHEWANSRYLDLLPFLCEQLNTHHFPDARLFVEHLLTQGNALLLLDGLDEVRQERNERASLALKLRNFSVKYDKCQYLVTCRVAASEYSFPGLRDVELADFTQEQVLQYAEKWFGAATRKFASFSADLQNPENVGLAELCNIPLFLSLLCLYFDDTMAFPPRRAELYEDALDALLRKWDSSRQIQRDEIYKNLSHKRKQQMFAHIATPAFERGEYYFTTKRLSVQICNYLSNLPGSPSVDDIDGETILRNIESQHGILVERARNIHSFSHLTFQEYFTARYVVENDARGTTKRMIRDHLTDPRWREVFLLTASLLDNADGFIIEMRTALDELVGQNHLADILVWSELKTRNLTKGNQGRYKSIHFSYISLSFLLQRSPNLAHANNLVHMGVNKPMVYATKGLP